jgi:hypothetical protein
LLLLHLLTSFGFSAALCRELDPIAWWITH